MEFHEKLQHLRKHNQLTQEQLAQRLFVSRAAVSKWESGRGYPNLETLKDISKLFAVSIDDLLSGEELIELAETENRSSISKVSAAVFGALDIMTVVFLLLPLFGQQDRAHIRAVTLAAYTGISAPLRILYLLALTVIPAFGVWEIIIGRHGSERGLRIYRPCSITLSAAAILLFAITRQPYMTTFLFLLFLVKIVLMMQEYRVK